MLIYHNASSLRAIFDCGLNRKILDGALLRLWFCSIGAAKYVTQIPARSRYINNFRIPYSVAAGNWKNTNILIYSTLSRRMSVFLRRGRIKPLLLIGFSGDSVFCFNCDEE
jgi:hypothetical protein